MNNNAFLVKSPLREGDPTEDWLNSYKLIHKLTFLVILTVVWFWLTGQVSAEGNIIYRGGGEPLLMKDNMFGNQQDRNSNNILKKEQIAERKKVGGYTTKSLSRIDLNSTEFELSADTINFSSENETVSAQGNVLFGYPTGTLEADRMRFKNQSSEVFLDGNIKVNDFDYTAEAKEAWLNLETKELKITDGTIYLEDGDFNLKAEQISKSTTDEYSFNEVEMTTCVCPDNDDVCPWKINAHSADITYNGYGIASDAVFEVDGVPVLYLPYFAFPAKTERQTGFLPPSIGTGKYSNLKLRLPLFVVLDESADLTFTPLYEASTRAGLDLELRKVFSKNHKLELGGSYISESMRAGKLQGLSTTGIYDPRLKEDRATYSVKHNLETRIEELSLQMITDARYANDKLIVREEIDPRLNPYNSRFLTSESVLRLTGDDKYMAEVVAEYNEALVDNQKVTFQKIPSFYLSGSEYFDVLGDNPFGASLVLNTNFSSVNFLRENGYDGNRTEIYEKITIPFNYKNIFKAELSTDLRASYYRLLNDSMPQDNYGWLGDVSGETTRFVPGFTYKLSSVLERVYQVNEDSWLKKIVDLGPQAVSRELVRTKHTLEMFMQYRYVPNINQSKNPQFDYEDHLSEKSLLTYGIAQSLYGKYEPYNENLYGIEEITPELEDLEQLKVSEALSQKFGVQRTAYRKKKGHIRELARLELGQSLNVLDNVEQPFDRTISHSDFSDLMANLTFYPNDHFLFRVKSNYSVSDNRFNSYSIEPRFLDNRGDELRLKFHYIDQQIKQLEGGLQVRLLKNTKFGYYTIYDDYTREFLEERLAFRFYSSCGCWTVDVGYSKKYNPRDNALMLNISLLGLGEFGKSFSTIDSGSRR